MNCNKVELALSAFAKGYNCSQSVVSTYARELGLGADAANKISSCFGGGMRMGATCGALTGALMVLGLAKGFADCSPEHKASTEVYCTNYIARWRATVGNTNCKEILGLDVSDPIERQKGKEAGVFALYCPNCIESAITLLEEVIGDKHNALRL